MYKVYHNKLLKANIYSENLFDFSIDKHLFEEYIITIANKHLFDGGVLSWKEN